MLSRREGVLHQIQKLTDPDYSLLGTTDLSSEYNLSWSTSHSHAHSQHSALHHHHSSTGAGTPGAGGGITPPPPHPGRSWTIPGSSFANIFPEHLRTRRSAGSSHTAAASPSTESAADAAIDLAAGHDLTDSGGGSRDSPDASPAAATAGSTVQQSSSTPMRLSDMLKRKRNNSRKSSR